MICFTVVSCQGLLLVPFTLHFQYLPGGIFGYTPNSYYLTYHCVFLVVDFPLSLVTSHAEQLCLCLAATLAKGQAASLHSTAVKIIPPLNFFVHKNTAIILKEPLGRMCTKIRELFLSGSAV